MDTMIAEHIKEYWDNIEVCLKAYQEASQENDPYAQFALGMGCRYGMERIRQDDWQAEYWFRKAAEQGDSDAMYELAIMYDEGIGPLQNHPNGKDEAYRWRGKAAAAKYTKAQARSAT